MYAVEWSSCLAKRRANAAQQRLAGHGKARQEQCLPTRFLRKVPIEIYDQSCTTSQYGRQRRRIFQAKQNLFEFSFARHNKRAKQLFAPTQECGRRR